MKTLILALAATIATASLASADGFVCTTAENNLKVQVYNHTTPQLGTRNGAVMILSNPEFEYGNQTIAEYHSDGLLTNFSSTYSARVDLRHSGSDRKGELIAGTRLGNVNVFSLAVDFTYAQPVAEGTKVEGQLSVVKRNGDVIVVVMECERYLKN